MLHTIGVIIPVVAEKGWDVEDPDISEGSVAGVLNSYRTAVVNPPASTEYVADVHHSGLAFIPWQVETAH